MENCYGRSMFGKVKQQPGDSLFLPHFRARIDILRKEDGGPWRGYMDFGPDGMTSLICNFPGFEGRQAVIVRHRPDARVAGGESFEADFMDAESGLLTGDLKPGLRFEVWSGRVLAHGEVTEIFAENWVMPPEKAAFVFCPQCKGHWQHPRCVTPAILRDAGEEARRRGHRSPRYGFWQDTAHPWGKAKRSHITLPATARIATTAKPDWPKGTMSSARTAMPSITIGKQLVTASQPRTRLLPIFPLVANGCIDILPRAA